MAIANQEKNDVSFKCTIITSCAKLGETKANGNSKELNYVSYGGSEPKWDIREWNEDHSKMSRGVTLTDDELFDLYAAIGEVMKHDKPSVTGPVRPKNAVNPWNTNGSVEAASEKVDASEDAEAVEETEEVDTPF